MTENRKCPKCGCDEWSIDVTAHDIIEYSCTISECGSIELSDFYNDSCGDIDYADYANCAECGHQIIIDPLREKSRLEKFRNRLSERYVNDDDFKVYTDAEVDTSWGKSGAWVQLWEWVASEDIGESDDGDESIPQQPNLT